MIRTSKRRRTRPSSSASAPFPALAAPASAAVPAATVSSSPKREVAIKTDDEHSEPALMIGTELDLIDSQEPLVIPVFLPAQKSDWNDVVCYLAYAMSPMYSALI
eukprot:Filipodium_phascolosomae@DN7688_c0_g1_i1.p1